MTHQNETFSKTLFGFWLYLMTDCILFSTLFATYAVLHANTYGGPSAKDLFDLPYALAETFALLISSFTSGLARIAAYEKNRKKVLFWFAITFLLGLCFLTLELREFAGFIHEGNSWERSAFLSSFFTLVGTHGAHISIGLFWMITLMVCVWRQGVTDTLFRRISCLSFFWHFLDIVWIFIFTIVYLMGVI